MPFFANTARADDKAPVDSPGIEGTDALLMPIALEDAKLAVAVARRIDKAVERLASFPESSPVFTEYLRRLSIPKLPYSCYYEYICGEVRIIHIRHDHQNPLQ